MMFYNKMKQTMCIDELTFFAPPSAAGAYRACRVVLVVGRDDGIDYDL